MTFVANEAYYFVSLADPEGTTIPAVSRRDCRCLLQDIDELV